MLVVVIAGALSGVAALIPAAPTCKVFNDTDFNGHDLKAMRGVAGPAACCGGGGRRGRHHHSMRQALLRVVIGCGAIRAAGLTQQEGQLRAGCFGPLLLHKNTLQLLQQCTQK